MNLIGARAFMPVSDRQDWNRQHLNYLPSKLYRKFSDLRWLKRK